MQCATHLIRHYQNESKLRRKRPIGEYWNQGSCQGGMAVFFRGVQWAVKSFCEEKLKLFFLLWKLNVSLRILKSVKIVNNKVNNSVSCPNPWQRQMKYFDKRKALKTKTA